MRLAGRIRDEIGAACRLPMLFRNTTMEQLAQALSGIEAEEDVAELVPLQTFGQREPLFCLCGVQLYPEEMALMGITVGADRRPPGVVQLAARYLEARRAKQPEGPYHPIGFSFVGGLAYEVAQQLRAAGQQVGLLATIDSDVPGHSRYRLPFRLKRNLRRLVYSRRGRRQVPPMTAAAAVEPHSISGSQRENMATWRQCAPTMPSRTAATRFFSKRFSMMRKHPSGGDDLSAS